MLSRARPKRLIGSLAFGVGLAVVTVTIIVVRKPATVSLDPSCRAMFVKVTRGYLSGTSPQACYYMHRFYIRSASLSPMSATLFEQLKDWRIYRNALQQGTFTVCERIVTGSNAVFWIGYDSKIPLSCVGALSLQDRNGNTLTLSQAENHTVKSTTRHVWSAVCSEVPRSTRQYMLQIDNRKIFIFTAP